MILLFEVLVGIMLYYEYKNFKTIATPFFILGGIYELCIPINNIVCTQFGIYRINNNTIFYFLCFLTIVFMAGFLIRKININKVVPIDELSLKILKKQTIVFRVFCVSGACFWLSYLQVVQKYGLNNTKGRAFGIFAHIGFLSRCLLPFIFYYYIKTKKKKYIITYLLVVLGLILFRGKYHLFIPIMGTLIIVSLLQKKYNVKRMVLTGLVTFFCAMLFFILVYSIIPNIINHTTDKESMKRGIDFSIQHFLHYLFCPFITSNSYFAMPTYSGLRNGLLTAFNPLNTLFQAFLGTKQYHNPALAITPIINVKGDTANVGGLFSETVFGMGFGLSALYVLIICIFTYYMFFKTIRYRKRIVTTIYLLSLLSLSFFCNFYSIFANFECLLYCYIMDILIFDTKIKI